MGSKKGFPKRRDIGLDIYGKSEEKIGGNNLLPAKNEEIFVTDIIIENLNFNELFNLTEDIQINKFLIEKSTELYKLHSKTALDLGKIFVEVEEKLGGSNQYDGVYTKWLERNGFNKMTALRYKRRYKLFEKLETSLGKNILMTLSQKIVDEISSKSDEEIKEYIKFLDEGKTKVELQKSLENKSKEVIEITYVSNFDFDKQYQKLDEVLKRISVQNLNGKKKESFEKDIQKIEKILQKYI